MRETLFRCCVPLRRRRRAMTASRQRIDRLLVERGLFESRAKAQAAIEAGLVTADDADRAQGLGGNSGRRDIARERRASLCVARRREACGRARPLSISTQRAASASTSAPRPADSRRCCSSAAPAVSMRSMSDTASSTKSCARGPRSCRSKTPTSARCPPARFSEPPDLVTVDVSFISLKLVLPPALALAKPARATCCADQAAIRGRPRRRQERHRARPGRARRRVRRHR